MRIKNFTIVIIFLVALLSILGMGERFKNKGARGDITTQKGMLHDLQGNVVNPGDYIGKKVVLLNFFATWCPPCRAEMPSMETLHQRMTDQDFIILAVDLRESAAKVKTFMSKNNYTFPVFIDSTGALANQYKVRSIPTSFLLSKSGKIEKKILGAIDWTDDDVMRFIEELVAR